MRMEYVLMNCDECGTENRFNHLIETKKNFSITLCYDCLLKLKKKIKDYTNAEEEKNEYLRRELDEIYGNEEKASDIIGQAFLDIEKKVTSQYGQ